VAVNLAAASSQSVAAIGFGHTFATVPAVMITGMTGSGAPAMLVPQAANVTTTGFDLVLANPSAVQVTGEYSFNWIATAVAGTQQTWYRDQDGDGYSDGTSQTREGDAPTGYYLASALTATSGDCDDGNAAVHPGVSELCDELDNDCDGLVDVRSAPHCDWDVGVCEPTHREKCWAGTWVCDYGPHYEPEETTCDGLDNDCDGVTDEGLVGEPCALQEGVCAGSTTVCDDRGGVTCQYPPEYEEDEVTCDELDNDCDGLVDLRSAPHCDRDDGVCEPTYREKCWAGTWVCDYGPHYEPEEESCDNLDNDCDGQTDEGC